MDDLFNVIEMFDSFQVEQLGSAEFQSVFTFTSSSSLKGYFKDSFSFIIIIVIILILLLLLLFIIFIIIIFIIIHFSQCYFLIIHFPLKMNDINLITN